MKTIMLCIFVLTPKLCFANIEMLEPTIEWLASFNSENIEFGVDKSAIKFAGCKQVTYSASINRPITKSTSLEMGVGYAKGRHSWGVFNQRVSVKELSVIPRYQFTHDVSLGLGVILQTPTEFTTAQGVQFDLPKNSEWLLNARIDGVHDSHYWEVALASQTWDGNQYFSSTLDKKVTNNKLELQYKGYF
ncbi:hypothetical protein [Paraglaciecola sp. 2405UD69-4]|uniref:hypothetical protein n=1 Tax=Paraglaciecola sp. 2405UD69-4 TaxID=3391836 RepID=UPI0039C97DEA